MEENKEKNQEPDVNLGGGITQKATFITTEPQPAPCRLASGKTLRREMIYRLRDAYVIEHQRIPSEEEMEEFAVLARKEYMDQGDYSIKDGVATYLGKF